MFENNIQKIWCGVIALKVIWSKFLEIKTFYKRCFFFNKKEELQSIAQGFVR